MYQKFPVLLSDTVKPFKKPGLIYSRFDLHGLIRAGFKDEADRILTAMLITQRLQGFQNGIIDKYLGGAEWKTWNGEPCGYEGYLNDNYYYLLTAAIINEDNYRKLFRPTWK